MNNTVRTITRFWMSAAMVLGLAAVAPAQSSQSSSLARFEVPFAFEVEGRPMAAGTYELSTTGNKFLVLTCAADRRLAFSRIWHDGELTAEATAALTFMKAGDQYVLTSGELMGRQVRSRVQAAANMKAAEPIVLFAKR